MEFKANPEHIFECTYPVPVDEIIWVNHPELPIKACQYGMVIPFVDDRDIVLTHGTRMTTWGIPDKVTLHYTNHQNKQRMRLKGASGGLSRWVYETFAGYTISSKLQIKQWNFNPWDNRPENLYLPSKCTPQELASQQNKRERFILNSIEEMVKRENWFTPDSDMAEYFNVIGVPSAITKYYKELREVGYIKFSTQGKMKYNEIKNKISHI